MSNIKPIRYSIDITGIHPDNLIQTEHHRDIPPRNERIIIPQYGPFYADSLRITDETTSLVLEKDVQYRVIHFDSEKQLQTGLSIAWAFVITDRNVGNSITIDYQTFGGDGSLSGSIIEQALEQLKNDNRPISWSSILGKPDGFKPSPHMHDIGDVYGFEHIVYAIYELKKAILIGDAQSHLLIYDYIDNTILKTLGDTKYSLDAINNHISDYNNPHRVTAEQVGTLTTEQINTAIQVVNDALEQFKENRDNPHSVTSEQVGTYDKQKIEELINAVKGEVGQVVKELEKLLFKEGNFFKSARFDISDNPKNLLTVVEDNEPLDGLLVTSFTGEQHVYIDSLVGVDQTPDVEAEASKESAPLNTIKYAFDNYYKGSKLVIHLKEGMEYLLDAEYPILLNAGASIEFRPYGPRSNPIINRPDYLTDNTLKDFAPNIVLTKEKLNTDNKYIYSVFKTLGSCVMEFKGVKLSRRVSSESLSGNVPIANETGFIQHEAGFLDVRFLNSVIDTGSIPRRLDQDKHLALFKVNQDTGTLSLTLSNTLDKTTGGNYLLDTTTKSKCFLTVQQSAGIDTVYQTLLDKIAQKQDKLHDDDGNWEVLVTNVKAVVPRKPYIYERDDKLFANTKINGQWVEVQIYPAVWHTNA